MRHRRFALLSIAVAASGLFAAGPSRAANLDEAIAEAVAAADAVDATAQGIVSPFVPGVPDGTGAVEIPSVTGGMPYPDGTGDPDGGGSSTYSQRYCGKYQWNNGTEKGSTSQPMQPCMGGSGRDYLVGTGTRDNYGTTYDGGYGDILIGKSGADFLSGGRSDDILYGDFVNGDTSNDGADILDGGVGQDKLIGGRGNDEFFGGEGADEFYAADGYHDVIHCADSYDQAAGDRRLKNYDYVEYDRYDTLDSTCQWATKKLK